MRNLMKKSIKLSSMQKITIKIINAFLILLILGVIGFEIRLLTRAEDAPGGDAAPAAEGDAEGEEAEAPPIPEDRTCENHMKNFMAAKNMEFGQFLDEHFSSKKPTSELINAAVERYRQYKAEISAETAKFSPKEGKDLATGSPKITLCQTAVRENFAIIRDLFRQRAKANASAKKSTRLLDKYKEINEKLDKLNFTIAQTYAYFAALSQKLPCYAKKCIR